MLDLRWLNREDRRHVLADDSAAEPGRVGGAVRAAHNARHPVSGNSVAEVLHSFDREDRLDRDSLTRLVGSISRYLGTAAPGDDGEGLSLVSSRRLGGAWALDGLWRRVGIDTTIAKLAAGRRLDAWVERVLFALVANRALEPSSKLAATRWVAERAFVPGVAEVSDDACYRAMDWLLEVEPDLATAVYWSVADLLKREVDLLFFDTTSTYFEAETPDEPVEAATVGSGPSASPRTTVPTCLRW